MCPKTLIPIFYGHLMLVNTHPWLSLTNAFSSHRTALGFQHESTRRTRNRGIPSFPPLSAENHHVRIPTGVLATPIRGCSFIPTQASYRKGLLLFNQNLKKKKIYSSYQETNVGKGGYSTLSWKHQQRQCTVG